MSWPAQRMTARLHDPRHFGIQGADAERSGAERGARQHREPQHLDIRQQPPLVQAVSEIESAASTEQQRLLRQLSQQISAMLETGQEKLVREALRSPSSPQTCRWLMHGLDAALSPEAEEGGVNIRVYAIPVLIVAGGSSAGRVPGVLSDTEEIRVLFESAGALGHCRNFGLSNALTDLGRLETFPWAALHSISHSQAWAGLSGLDLPPADMDVVVDKETVHLRFMVGAALTPSNAPGFIEAAGDIGGWGLSLTRLLGRQLATRDLSVLAIPRSPATFVHAARQGWYAAREMGFQLFLSKALREVRLGFGEPEVTITACSDQIIRVRLTSPFDELFDRTYGWPLSLSDDFDEIESSIFALLKEARVERIQVAPTVEDVTDVKRTSH